VAPRLAPKRQVTDGVSLAAIPHTILIVERDPHVRALAASFLAGAGHRVEVSSDGQAALAQVRTLMPDLVLCEILVPKLDGLALCRQLKANPETRHILVLVVSILAAGARADDAGADGFLLKPLAQHRLIAMVQGLLEKRSPISSQQERP
jgi:CheY-like chemotaxis protein